MEGVISFKHDGGLISSQWCDVVPHVQLKVRRLHPAAKLPTRAHPTDAGLDFYAARRMPLHPTGQRVAIGTGVAIEIPPGWCLLLKTRSGMASAGYDVHGGVVDASYRGEIYVLLSSPPREFGDWVEEGVKIAQGLLVPVPSVEIIEVDELSPSDRGAAGFGSTGA